MKTIIKWVILFSLANITQATENIHQNKIQSTVRVICATSANKISSGSGFVINPRHIATNWHVVECTSKGGKAIILLTKDEAYQVEKIVWKSKIKDLAILKLDKPLLSLRGSASLPLS